MTEAEQIQRDLTRAPEEISVTREKFQVVLPEWTGPYDVLLQVIEEQNLNLFNLNIAVLLEHYLKYLDETVLTDIDEAGEFLVVAATLAQIKSKLLLPKDEINPDEEEKDPREELVKYLIEYQKIREAAKALGERPLLGRDVFIKGAHEVFEGLEGEGSGKLFQLVKGFQKVMRELHATEPLEIEREEVSVAERRKTIFEFLKERHEIEFESLLREDFRKSFVIATFLAILELVRLKKMRILQLEPNAPLYLRFVEGASDTDIVQSEFDEEFQVLAPSDEIASQHTSQEAQS